MLKLDPKLGNLSVDVKKSETVRKSNALLLAGRHSDGERNKTVKQVCDGTAASAADSRQFVIPSSVPSQENVKGSFLFSRLLPSLPVCLFIGH